MENNIKLLDGSMSYPLELDGYNLNNRLWTGDALINNPELIKKIHKGYINSGADYLLTSTYQISYDILREKGIHSEKIKEVFRGKDNDFSIAICLNAAAGLIVSDKINSFKEAYDQLRKHILSGKVENHLSKLVK